MLHTEEVRGSIPPSPTKFLQVIAQEGDPVLSETARALDLPAEAEDARRVVAQLVSSPERVGQVHNFTKGMGLAAPQIRIGKAAAVIRTPDGQTAMPASATWATTKTVAYTYGNADLLTKVTGFNGNPISIGNTADGLPNSVSLGSLLPGDVERDVRLAQVDGVRSPGSDVDERDAD
jgi:polypeptide deformylase